MGFLIPLTLPLSIHCVKAHGVLLELLRESLIELVQAQPYGQIHVRAVVA